MENAPEPSATPQSAQAQPASATAQDIANLNTIGTLYYVLAAITAVFSLFPIFHVLAGLALIFVEPKMAHPNDPNPQMIGWMFLIMGSSFILIGLAFAGLFLTIARRIRARRSHLFCVIGAGISCLMMPFGTALGVFALLLLMKPHINALFINALSEPAP